MKRLFDLCLALVVGALLLIPAAVIGLTVLVTSPGPVLYWSGRVWRHNRLFKMPKFRSMQVNAPVLATHLMTDPADISRRLDRFFARRVWMSFHRFGAF